MRCSNNWNSTPYLPEERREEYHAPIICRIAPDATSVTVQWFDNGCSGSHQIIYSKWGCPGETVLPLIGETIRINGLNDQTEYCIYILAENGRKSRLRRFRTGTVPGTVVSYLHPQDDAYAFSGQYVCSPSLVRLPNGALLASNDYYIAGGAQNVTTIFRSDDNGTSWRYVTDIMPCFWGTLFWHRDALYLLGMSTEYGDLLIGRSDDEGKNWCCPTVIARGAGNAKYNGLHRAPMRIETAAGRLWTAIDYGSWAHKEFRNALFSIPENADLLKADNWVRTEFLTHTDALPDINDGKWALEGNAICMPDGNIANILRYSIGKAQLNVTHPDHPEEMPVCAGLIDLPVGHTKFELLHAPGGTYYAIGNIPPMRTRLVLLSSDDLIHWHFERYLIDGSALDETKNAFQYPAALSEDGKLSVLCRTAYNCANSWHNSNYITFHSFSIQSSNCFSEYHPCL